MAETTEAGGSTLLQDVFAPQRLFERRVAWLGKNLTRYIQSGFSLLAAVLFAHPLGSVPIRLDIDIVVRHTAMFQKSARALGQFAPIGAKNLYL
jgi:hypothetical protein